MHVLAIVTLGVLAVTQGHRRPDKFSQLILDVHNNYRSDEATKDNASGMRKMRWNTTLADYSKWWAGYCKYEHSDDKSDGENIAYDSKINTDSKEEAMEGMMERMFKGEKPRYDWYNKKCGPGGACHYSQIAWAKTTELGCDMRLCRQFTTSWGNVPDVYFLVCRYSPKGNWNGEPPYKRYGPCKNCPKNSQCDRRKGLCY